MMPTKPKVIGGPPRRTTKEKGYGTRRWMDASKRFRLEHPWCAECERQGRLTPATCVDHIQPHRGNHSLMWSVANWQSMCASCHAIKTRQE